MDLLTNAIESIQIGVDDFRAGSRPRLLSAVRNIHAGILLLFKEALLRRSPPGSNEVLIKARIEARLDGPDQIAFVGAGRKTVDTQQVRERFKSLGIAADWKLFDQIADVRNEVEHYFPHLTQDAIAGVVASAMLIVRNFAANELGAEPRELLGQKTWEAMLQVTDLYQEERKRCDQALTLIAWESEALESGVKQIRCQHCGSGLLKPAEASSSYSDTTLQCRGCGSTREPDSYVAEAIAEALDWEAHVAMTDGGEEPYGECPDCGLVTYVYAERRCAHCGETAATECACCGTTMSASEMASSPLCGWCDYMKSKCD
jgi:hypothetical protein